jgi:hypothetical protein
LFTRGRPCLHDVELGEERDQALASLDVRLGRMELGERGVAYQLDALTASVSSSSPAPPCARPTR